MCVYMPEGTESEYNFFDMHKVLPLTVKGQIPKKLTLFKMYCKQYMR